MIGEEELQSLNVEEERIRKKYSIQKSDPQLESQYASEGPAGTDQNCQQMLVEMIQIQNSYLNHAQHPVTHFDLGKPAATAQFDLQGINNILQMQNLVQNMQFINQ